MDVWGCSQMAITIIVLLPQESTDLGVIIGFFLRTSVQIVYPWIMAPLSLFFDTRRRVTRW